MLLELLTVERFVICRLARLLLPQRLICDFGIKSYRHVRHHWRIEVEVAGLGIVQFLAYPLFETDLGLRFLVL
jgi:hypothetical protein